MTSPNQPQRAPAELPVSLFAYGTLMVAEVVRVVIGRVPPSESAVLEGYARYLVRGASYPAIVPVTNARVEGLVYDAVSPSEWRLLDAYEGDLYERRVVHVKTATGGLDASSYVVRPEHVGELGTELWSLDWYLQKYGAALPAD